MSIQELLLVLALLLFLSGGRVLPRVARFLSTLLRGREPARARRIREIARNLGIETRGKGEEELLREIEARSRVFVVSEP
ncbi:MAG: hypothetical protein HY555_06250 [Euryarchaeota archaeon]|nr:hypothetical protein [Euryarchaeota archaeon]